MRWKQNNLPLFSYDHIYCTSTADTYTTSTTAEL